MCLKISLISELIKLINEDFGLKNNPHHLFYNSKKIENNNEKIKLVDCDSVEVIESKLIVGSTYNYFYGKKINAKI